MEEETRQYRVKETRDVLRVRLNDFEERYWPPPPDASFRAYWQEEAAIRQAILSASPIDSEQKQALQRQVADLSHRVRGEQRKRRSDARQLFTDLRERITLAQEEIPHSASVADVQQIRADLAALRGRISDAAGLNSEQRSELWNAWQSSNRTSWTCLCELWSRNQAMLSTYLDEAETYLAGKYVRDARDRVRAFHRAAAENECSHADMRVLVLRAKTLWQLTDECARQKREGQQLQATANVRRWKTLLARQDRAKSRVAAELNDLERRASGARTDVAAALLRGSVAERRRVYARLDKECEELLRKIASTELSLVDK